jgi:threonine dehydrogenase-like Zn-dependent dehydrogenase
LVDVEPSRAEPAAQLGVAFFRPDDAPLDADLVVEASGSPEALARAIELAGTEATILVLGWYGDAAAPVPLGGAFHSRRLRLVCSQVGAVAPAMRPRWTHRRRLAKALELLRDPALDALIDGESAFNDLPDLLPPILESPRGGLCHRIVYPSDEA